MKIGSRKSEVGIGRPRGFTLLEVLLAMSLSILVLAGIGSAIHIHLRMVDVGRIGVEQAQLARAILTRIGDDLRASIQYEPPDTSGLSGAAPASSDPSSSSGRSSSSSSSSKSSSSSSSSSSDSSIADSNIPGITPGLYGSQFEVQMDVSRLPRLDQYSGSTSSQSATSTVLAAPPTDVKTVAYYLRTDTTNGPAGLVRREVDRAATLYAAEQGSTDTFDSSAELLATEVTDIEFVYYDGTDQFSDWDSNQKGSLPLAVEVILTLAVPEGSGSTPNANGLDEEPVYRMLVRLPSAHPVDQSSGSSSDSSSSDSGSSSSSTTSPQ